jgi:deoxyribodipyrimidine photo-lyase
MSNERCAMYNANELPRPIEVLERSSSDTETARDEIREEAVGDAILHCFKRDLRICDKTGLVKASEIARERGVGVIGVRTLSPQD